MAVHSICLQMVTITLGKMGREGYIHNNWHFVSEAHISSVLNILYSKGDFNCISDFLLMDFECKTALQVAEAGD